MSAADLDDAAVWRWWCQQSSAQGLDPEIRDPSLICRLITLAFAGEGGDGRARTA